MIPEEILAAIFGPLQWHITAGSSQQAHATYRGVPVLLHRSFHRRHNDYSTTLKLALSRPIELHVMGAGQNNRLEYTPVIDTGDEAFHAVYEVRGSPLDIIARALDPALRQRLVALPIFPGTLRGVIDINISWNVEGAREITGVTGQQRGWDGSGDPNLARAQVELFFDLIENIRRLYDQTYLQLEATQGSAAAQAWHGEQVAALDRASRAKVKTIMLAMIPAFVLLLSLVLYLMFL